MKFARIWVFALILSHTSLLNAGDKKNQTCLDNQYVKISLSDGKEVKDSYFAYVPGEYFENIAKAFDVVLASKDKSDQEFVWEVYRVKANGKDSYAVFELVGSANPIGKNKVGVVLLPEKAGFVANGGLSLYQVPQDQMHTLFFLKKGKGKESGLRFAPETPKLQESVIKNLVFPAISDQIKSSTARVDGQDTTPCPCTALWPGCCIGKCNKVAGGFCQFSSSCRATRGCLPICGCPE